MSWNCDGCQAEKSNFLKIHLILGQTGQHTPGLSAQSVSVWGMGCDHPSTPHLYPTGSDKHEIQVSELATNGQIHRFKYYQILIFENNLW